MPQFDLRYNIAPSTMILSLRNTVDGRTGIMTRWGFVPSWCRDPSAMPLLHNARAEKVASSPMFRRAFRKRRCLVPASGFYEWKTVPGQKSKQPFYISFKDSTPIALAGLWESTTMIDGSTLDTCAITTTQANAELAPIHPRMPAILRQDDWDRWLNPELPPDEELLAMLRPYDGDRLQAWGVVHAVNKLSNDSPALIRPIASGRKLDKEN